jgi:cytoskeletal protein CcmA (bactofilin family)
VRSTALVVIGERGSLDGLLRASEILVLGEVRGEICGAERLEIGPGGRVYGKVEVRALVVNEGGLLEAECAVGK